MATTYLVGEQTKRKIFKISRQLFYKKGYDETTYDDISKLAKVNRALIPYYFKNKKNLALLVFQKFIEDYYAVCDKTMEGLDMSGEVRTAVYMFGYSCSATGISPSSLSSSTAMWISTSVWSPARRSFLTLLI